MSEFLAGQAIDLSGILNKPAVEKARQLPKPQGYKILVRILTNPHHTVAPFRWQYRIE